MSRLVVVSNRVADLSAKVQSGGLAVGVGDALRQHGGLWFGWDGNIVQSGTRVPPTVTETGPVKTVTLPMTAQDHSEYYNGFSNSVLWPVFHYRLDLAQHQANFISGYKRVNSKFANALSPLLEPDDIIWVHDYHLIPLAWELRKRGHEQKIGFFLHIPFPPSEILAAAPEHEWLLNCLMYFDLVGFQSHTDLVNFEHYMQEQRGAELSGDGRVSALGKQLTIGRFPIGIDVESFREMAFSEEADEQIEFLKRRSSSQIHVIGVDRLDYSKGLPDRMRAFNRLLELYPDMQKDVSLMQIAPPTRENVGAYTEIREELESLSGAINGAYADFDWTPVRYIHRMIPRNILAALFRGSQVGLVTPLRDGMNLVAKEFVAAQDESDPGVLILSQFAGAAEQMTQALLVNPYDTDEMAHTLYRAIKMPLEERQERQQALFRCVVEHDARDWSAKFLSALKAA